MLPVLHWPDDAEYFLHTGDNAPNHAAEPHHIPNLLKSAVELASMWRMDKALRQLEAMMIVADKSQLLVVSGTGEVIEPEDGICAIGSGGNYALAAAKALRENTEFSAREIVEKALNIAGDICVFTNHNLTIEEV